VPKDHARLHAYGTVDELNSVLGLVIALQVQADLVGPVERIQRELFSLGADLATPLEAEAPWMHRLTTEPITRLENEIDQFESVLPPLKNFILPGGTPAAAALHQARTVCRRAERWMVTLREELNPHTLVYINRLSDWLFVAARIENLRAGLPDPIWTAEREQSAS
jgi:cob(I)alamin adenosyltransferase